MPKIKEKILKILSDNKKMDDIIFMRFFFYGVVLVLLLCIAIVFPLATHRIEYAIFPLIAFLGMSFMTMEFTNLYKNGQLVIVYAVCESKDICTENVLDRFHTIVDKKQQKYEYRLLTVSDKDEDSYIYLILPEFNRMREGAAYKILFRKNGNEYSEKNMIAFTQIQQNIQEYDADSQIIKEQE